MSLSVNIYCIIRIKKPVTGIAAHDIYEKLVCLTLLDTYRLSIPNNTKIYIY